MTRIIIDDNKLFATAICCSDDVCYTNNDYPGKVNEPIKVNGQLELRKLAEEIIYNGISQEAIFFININLKIGPNNRQELCGAELLIWLRIKKVLNHCVLYSFETLHSLLNRHAEYLITTTKGTSFLQLPVDSRAIELTNESFKKQADPDNIKNALKIAFSLEEFRHREANWWGVKAMWDVYKVMMDNPKADYPIQIIKKLEILNNSIAQYIYEFSVKKLQTVIAEEEAERKRNYNMIIGKINELSIKLQPVVERVNSNADEINKLNSEIEQLTNSYLALNDANISHQIRKLKEDIDFYKEAASFDEEEKKILENEQRSIQINADSLKKQLENILSVLQSRYSEIVKENSKWITEINTRKPKVLFIDDNAENGWSYLLKKMYKGATIKCVIPDSQYKDKVGQLFVSQIRSEIDSEDPTLILLDLRLFDEEDSSIDIERLSGLKLLRLIRGHYPALPIIITTASNKIWSFKQLTFAGADAYWIKEGIDEKRNARSSIENYTSLIRLIAKASDKKYSIIKSMLRHEAFLASTKMPWWETGYWANGDKRQGKTKNIKNIISSSIVMIRLCLQEYHMNLAGKSRIEESYFISSIILRLSSVYEFVHDVDRDTFKSLAGSRGGVSSFLEKVRGDKSFLALKKLRNQSAHSEFSNSNWEMLEKAVNEVINYLENPHNTH